MKRPENTEYAEFYAGYVSQVEGANIIEALEKQHEEMDVLFSGIAEERGTYAYEPGKWTIKQLLGHLIDGERVFSYRALRFARGDKTELPGFDQDPYVANGNANNISMDDLLDEFLALRKSNIIFFKNLSEEAWSRTGTASSNEITVRALAFIMVGHVAHHVKILKQRYLS